MSRSKKQKRSKSSKRSSTQKRFGIESMEARRLMAGDFAVAGDVAPVIDAVEIESVRPIAIVAESETPMPQTREHILLGRQVGGPSLESREVDSESELLIAVSNMRDADSRGQDQGFQASDGTSVGTADEVLAPELDGEEDVFTPDDKLYDPTRDDLVDPADPAEAPPTKDPSSNPHGSADEVLAPELDGEEDVFTPDDKLYDPTRDDLIDPADPAEAPPTKDPSSNPHGSADEVLAPELDGEEDVFTPDDKLYDPTRDDLIDPADPAEAPPTKDPSSNPHGSADEVLAPELDGEEDYANAAVGKGDINGDGVVNFADFLILSANYGKEVKQASSGDFNDNGVVDFQDFLQFASVYGSTEATDAVFASLV